MSENLVEIKDLVTEFPMRGWGKAPFRALQGINLQLAKGETLGLVGESGSGKTTLGRAVLGLAPVTEGSIIFEGRNLATMTRQQRRQMSDQLQVVFQDPYTSLNPAMSIEEILAEPLRVRGTSRVDANTRIAQLLDRVQLPADSGQRLPREFSGGQRQRVAIARALALNPRLIVCDEPVSALDLSTQARILDLFLELQEDTGVAYLFISHDLEVVRHISHRVAVMYRGEIVECGDAAQVTKNPEHPYTRRLLMASPVPNPAEQKKRREERKALSL
ncbi:ATP-binding cassette domain-containing protein [Arthrobacter sp. BF1]|uniref:ATP-binding cassette domain-containing protein n=1 Tax=Arthrobacter sp. BF1 TaxID=2821145 RepID=UPI001C4FB6E7|nr:ATP-binding cassette domain-containing protein [Arthrobacter sp. BF1]